MSFCHLMVRIWNLKCHYGIFKMELSEIARNEQGFLIVNCQKRAGFFW